MGRERGRENWKEGEALRGKETGKGERITGRKEKSEEVELGK